MIYYKLSFYKYPNKKLVPNIIQILILKVTVNNIIARVDIA